MYVHFGVKALQRKVSAVFLALSTIVITSTIPALASSVTTSANPQFKMYLNGTLVSQAACEVRNGTVYVPIWYVARSWEYVGGISRWDWTKQSWYLQPSTGPGLPPAPNLLIDDRTGKGSIYVNGSLTGEHIPVLSEVDPSSQRPTVYMPAFTLIQIFGCSFGWQTTKWVRSGNSIIWQIGFSTTPSKSDTDSLLRRVQLLQQAVAPTSPQDAANTWAKALQSRNGALQFAILTPQLQDKMKDEFVSWNWSPGASSPWIEACRISPGDKISDTLYKFIIVLTLTNSTRNTTISTSTIFVTKLGRNWFVSDIGGYGTSAK